MLHGLGRVVIQQSTRKGAHQLVGRLGEGRPAGRLFSVTLFGGSVQQPPVSIEHEGTECRAGCQQRD
ncbi:MAG: hypothetical protein ACK4NM_15510 [Hydrogenophaga sp.]